MCGICIVYMLILLDFMLHCQKINRPKVKESTFVNIDYRKSLKGMVCPKVMVVDVDGSR